MGEFAARLRGLRDAAALTQEELAERAGLTANAIGALERGERRRPYPHTVRALADALALDEAQRAGLAAAARPGGAAPAVPDSTHAPAGDARARRWSDAAARSGGRRRRAHLGSHAAAHPHRTGWRRQDATGDWRRPDGRLRSSVGR